MLTRKQWYENTPGVKAYRKRWRKENHWRIWGYALKHKYGITTEQYDVMLKQQRGVCAVCGYPPRRRRLGVDHDHVTNRVRGLLCQRCNPLVERMATYLASK